MKILIVNPILYTSEISKVRKVTTIKDTMIYNMCLAFKRNGYEPVLIAAEDYRPIDLETYDFEIVFLKTKIRKIFKPNCFPLLGGLGKFLKERVKEFDYIISSEVFSLSSLLLSCQYKEKTLIWHELAKHNNILKKIPSKIWYNIIARFCFNSTRIIPRSRNAYEFISNYCNNVSKNYIDHGVDFEKFDIKVEKINKENQFIVLSQLIERKRIDGIIRIFADFIKKVDNKYKLRIVGDGKEKDKLMNLVKELKIENEVIFEGFMLHNQMIPILASSKAMIINTIKDNNMVSIVESIATCTPIVTTLVPYNVDYIKEFNLGIAKDVLDYKDLKKIVEDNERYVENCKKYRCKISNDYHVQQFIEEYNKMKEGKK